MSPAKVTIRKDFDSFCETVRTGDTIAVKGNSFISKGIRKITHSDISHVGIAFWVDSQLLLVEMDGVKNVLVPLSQYSDTDLYLYESPMGIPPYVNQIIWQLLRYERNYNWSNFIKLFFSNILSIGGHLPRVLYSSEICTEFNMTFYRWLGWETPLDGFTLSPEKFCELLGDPTISYNP